MNIESVRVYGKFCQWYGEKVKKKKKWWRSGKTGEEDYRIPED